ncbi:MAG: lamin tail domain-containing protein [Deltaproteobacteria bacterium]|nr:MAG: lamin tail domain-containing protein [Deltaproteobacteria bacterium]
MATGAVACGGGDDDDDDIVRVDAATTTPDAAATTPDAGSATPDGGSATPDGGSTTPDGGSATPDGGALPDAATPPDGGSATPDGGSATPDGGALPDAATPPDGGALPDAAVPVMPAAAGDVVITEIMQNPKVVADADGEWFELYNPTTATWNLEGCTIKDSETGTSADAHTIDAGGAGLLLAPGAYLVLGPNADPETNDGVKVDYAYPVADFRLGNGADEVIVECAGVTIDMVAYDGGPTFPDPNGASMNLDPSKFNATDNDDGANWCTATASYSPNNLGTPGAPNTPCSTAP